MSTKPTSYLDWTDGDPNKVQEPDASKKLLGFIKNERVSFRYFNWLLHYSDLWIKYLEEKSDSKTLNIISVNSNYTVTINDGVILVDASSNSITITLHSISLRTGKLVLIKKVDSTLNEVIINTSGSEYIDDNELAKVLSSKYSSICLVAGSDKWYTYFTDIIPYQPLLTSASPNILPLSGGLVTLYGSDLNQGSRLKVGDNYLPYTTISPTEAQVNLPASTFHYAPDFQFEREEILSISKDLVHYDRTNILSVDGGGSNPSIININYLDTRTTGNYQPVILNNELYIIFIEPNDVTNQLRIKKYNGDDNNPAWTLVEEQTTQYGLNRDTSKNVVYVSAVVFNNKIYVTWTEMNSSSSYRIRVGRYDPNDPDKWKIIDGNTEDGLNYATSGSCPNIFIYDNTLYVTWAEGNYIRVKAYISSNWVWACDSGGTVGIYRYSSPNYYKYHPIGIEYDGKLFLLWIEYDINDEDNIYCNIYDPNKIESGNYNDYITRGYPYYSHNFGVYIYNNKLYLQAYKGYLGFFRYKRPTLWELETTNISSGYTTSSSTYLDPFYYILYREPGGYLNLYSVSNFDSLKTPYKINNLKYNLSKGLKFDRYNLVTFNNKLYAFWAEEFLTNIYQLRCKVIY